MISRLTKTTLATCLLVGVSGVGSGYAHDSKPPQPPRMAFALPAPPPGMVPMIIYVPAQQMQAPIPPHTHAPQAATIEGTHCLINDVAVLTQDAPSCEKAGGEVAYTKSAFGIVRLNCHKNGCHPYPWPVK